MRPLGIAAHCCRLALLLLRTAAATHFYRCCVRSTLAGRDVAGGVFCLTYPTSHISARKPGLDTAVIEVGSGSSAQQQQQCAAAAVRGGNSARQCSAASRVSSQQPETHPQNPSESPQPIGSRNLRGAYLRSCGTAALLLALLLRHTTPHLCRSCFWCVSAAPLCRRNAGMHPSGFYFRWVAEVRRDSVDVSPAADC